MSARVPVKGSLTFIDSRGNPNIKGIDVGQELEYRSHIEGEPFGRDLAVSGPGSQIPTTRS